MTILESEDTHYKVKIQMFESHHSYLSAIMLNQAKQAIQEEIGHQFRWIIPAMAFAVFQVESICNLYGSQLIKDWDLLESTSFLGKVSLLSEKLDIEVNWAKEPWQTINKMKSFRNALVHLKPNLTKPKYVFVKKTINLKHVHRYALLINGYPSSNNNLMSLATIHNMDKFTQTALDLERQWMYACHIKAIDINHFSRPITEILNN